MEVNSRGIVLKFHLELIFFQKMKLILRMEAIPRSAKEF